MYPEDIEALFPTVPVGTKVRIINEPIKTAFADGELLLEAHLPVDKEGQTYEPDLGQFAGMLDKVLGETTAAVHWDFAKQALETANGLPTVVGLQADLDPPEGQAPVAAEVGSAEAPAHIAAASPQEVSPAHAGGTAPPSDSQAAPVAEDRSVTTLPAPLPAPDSHAPTSTSGNGTRTYGAGEPAEATAQPTQPGQPSP
jgi:hypothetical protein